MTILSFLTRRRTETSRTETRVTVTAITTNLPGHSQRETDSNSNVPDKGLYDTAAFHGGRAVVVAGTLAAAAPVHANARRARERITHDVDWWAGQLYGSNELFETVSEYLIGIVLEAPELSVAAGSTSTSTSSTGRERQQQHQQHQQQHPKSVAEQGHCHASSGRQCE